MKHDWNVALNTDHLAVNGPHKNIVLLLIILTREAAPEETMLQRVNWYHSITASLKHFRSRFTYKLLLLGDFCQVISYRNILCSDEYVEEGCLYLYLG